MLFGVLPHAVSGNDDQQRFDDLQELLRHGHLSDGRYSLVGPVLSTPVVLLGRVVKSEEWWAAHFNVLLVAAGALVVWRLLRDRVDAALLRHALLVLLSASLLTNALRSYATEVTTATLVVVGVCCIATGRYPTAGWVAVVVAAVNTPAVAVALVPFAGYEAFRTKRLRPFAWLALAVVLVMSEAWLRRGSPFDSGYNGERGFRTVLPYSGKPEFSYPLLLGIASILFSFGRGLLFFAPGLLLWFDSRIRRGAADIRPVLVPTLLVTLGLVLVYAKWWAWYGGITWGPRFFTFVAVPASLLVAVSIRRAGASLAADLLVLTVLSLSAWVGVLGAVSDYSQLPFCTVNDYALESMCWYVPEFSSLWWPILHPPGLTPRVTILVVWCFVVFAYLALPLVHAIASSLRERVAPAAWLHGWRL